MPVAFVNLGVFFQAQGQRCLFLVPQYYCSPLLFAVLGVGGSLYYYLSVSLVFWPFSLSLVVQSALNSFSCGIVVLIGVSWCVLWRRWIQSLPLLPSWMGTSCILNFIFSSSLLVYSKAIDFYVLSSYPAALLLLSGTGVFFFVFFFFSQFFWFSYTADHVNWEKRQFLIFFLNLYTSYFLSLPCLHLLILVL